MQILDLPATLDYIDGLMYGSKDDVSLLQELDNIKEFAVNFPAKFVEDYPRMAQLKEDAELDNVLDQAIKLVRSDKVIGRGSCSVVDETMTDVELRDYFKLSALNVPPRWRRNPKVYFNRAVRIHQHYVEHEERS